MRTFLLAVLMASAAATPAAAAPDDRESRREARAERQEARERERSERQSASEARSERQEAREARAERVVEARQSDSSGSARAEAVARANGRDVGAIRDSGGERASGESLRQRLSDRQQLREQRRETLQQNRRLRQSDRAVPPVLRTPVPVVSDTPREGTQPPLRVTDRRNSQSKWSTHWRNNRRYDWYNWRLRNRSLFRLGFYHDPFGWSYRPYSIGWRLWPSYYSSRYWLHDPWQYRLPYAPPGYRWIRYYNDAILIDTWDGRVVDVMYNFFW